jgi:hypothetical protein
MKVLTVYLRIYADAFRQALTGIGKNVWTLLLPIGLFVGGRYVLVLLVSLGLGSGLLGGIIGGLLLCAVVSCYLYFVGEVVAKSRVKLDEFGRSVGAYFWSVANLFFVYWIASLVIGLIGPGTGFAFDELLWWASVILLNAAPEVIYQRGSYGGLETVQRSVKFLQANWIEWGIPNLLVVGAWYYLRHESLVVDQYVPPLLLAALEGALVHVVMVFRGHLFAALDGTSHRQRMYRYRSSGAV